MGKVLKPIIAVAAVAVAFIPGVGPALSVGVMSLGASASTALAITAGIASFGMSAALGSPVANMEAINSFGGTNLMSHFRTAASNMPPRRGRRHWFRFRAVEVSGNCMLPHMPAGWLGLIDRHALIRAGDMIYISTGDDFVLKRFTELDDTYIHVETTWPHQTYRIPLETVRWAYRVRAMARSKRGIRQAIRNILASAESHQERIASIIVRDDRELV